MFEMFHLLQNIYAVLFPARQQVKRMSISKELLRLSLTNLHELQETTHVNNYKLDTSTQCTK